MLQVQAKCALSGRADKADLHAIWQAVDEAAEKMPSSYSSRESLNSADLSWVRNLWNRKRVALTPISEQIVEYVREYYAPEMIGFSVRSKRKGLGARRAGGFG